MFWFYELEFRLLGSGYRETEMCSGSKDGGWLVFKAHRVVHHLNLGLREIQKRRKFSWRRGHEASWKRMFKLSRREAGPPHHLDDQVNLDQ